MSILGYCLFFTGIFSHRLGLPDTPVVGLIGLVSLIAGELTRNYRKGLSTKTKRLLLASAGYFAALIIADFLLPSDIEMNTLLLVLFAAAILGFWGLLLVSFYRMEREAQAIDQIEETDSEDD